MGLVLQLVETRADGGTCSVELMELGRPGNLHDIAELGLTLPEAKQLRRAAAGVPALRGRLPREGLSPAPQTACSASASGSASKPPTIRIRQQPSRHDPQARNSPPAYPAAAPVRWSATDLTYRI